MAPSVNVLLGSNPSGSSLTTSGVVPAGDRIVFVLEDFSTTLAISSFTSGGLTWVVDRAGAGDANNVNVIVASAYAPAGLASGTVLAPTVTGPNVPTCCAFSLSGVQGGASGYLSGTPPTPASTFGGTTTWVTPTVTTVDDSTIVIGVTAHDGVATMSSTPTSGSEIYDFVNGTSTQMLTVVYRVVSGAAGYTTAGTFSAAPSERRCATVAYKASGAGPAPPDGIYRPVRMKGAARA